MKGLVFGKFLGIAALVSAVGLVGCADETSATEGSDEAAEGVAQAPLVDGAAPAGADPAKKVAKKDRGDRGDRDAKDPRGDRGPRGGKHGPGHGGPEQLFRAALEELDLNGAQKSAIEGALADLEAARPERPEPSAKGDGPFAAIADGVRKGTVDTAAVEAAFAKQRPDHTAHQAAMTKALGTLHATLTGAQRRELVDSITARMDEREKAFAEKHAERGAKGDAERGAKDDAERGPRGEGHGKGGGPVGHLLRGLDLRDDQQAKVDAILAGLAPEGADRKAFEEKHATMKKEMKARLESFASDRFDAAAALPPKDDAMKGDHAARMAQALAAIVPVLDEAQRDALADRLEQGPMGKGFGGKGFGGKGGRGMRGGAR